MPACHSPGKRNPGRDNSFISRYVLSTGRSARKLEVKPKRDIWGIGPSSLFVFFGLVYTIKLNEAYIYKAASTEYAYSALFRMCVLE